MRFVVLSVLGKSDFVHGCHEPFDQSFLAGELYTNMLLILSRECLLMQNKLEIRLLIICFWFVILSFFFSKKYLPCSKCNASEFYLKQQAGSLEYNVESSGSLIMLKILIHVE